MQSLVRVLLSRSNPGGPRVARTGPNSDEQLASALGKSRHRRERPPSRVQDAHRLFALRANQADDHLERLFDRGAGRWGSRRISRYRIFARLSDRGGAGPAARPGKTASQYTARTTRPT